MTRMSCARLTRRALDEAQPLPGSLQRLACALHEDLAERRMRSGMGMLTGGGLVLLLSWWPVSAAAQQPQPYAPPPGSAPAYPAYPSYPPPAGSPGAYPAYPPPPTGYYQPYPGAAPYAQLPPSYPYEKGTPIPPGYHLEDRPRQGFLTAGYVVTAVPYFIGLMAAASSGFANQSAWLAIPFAGPWLTMGQREYACLGKEEDPDEDRSCAEDALLAVFIMDGLVQAIGGTFLMLGYLVTKEYVVRNDLGYVVTPSRIGSGYGLSLVGRI